MHKKITIMIFLVFLSVSTIPATQAHDGQLIDEGRILGFTIEPSFGYLTGEVREIVYFDSANKQAENPCVGGSAWLSILPPIEKSRFFNQRALCVR